MDFKTVLMLTGGTYLLLLLASNIPIPNRRFYRASHFKVIVLTIFSFCLGCIRMCHDQNRSGRVAENMRSLSRIIDESQELERELKRLDPSDPRDHRRLREITKRIKEIRVDIERAGTRSR